MFASVLVANRGEIARRVFRTAKAMGLRTIAVYSDADAKAAHVREADAAIRIGPAPARESYLDGAAILAAAREGRAEAIHPGYGFLSENPEFAEAVLAAGLVWIGPPPAAIRAMGLKDEAKRIAEAAGVPVTPGYAGEDQSLKRLKSAAEEIGYPVLIKAVAGGGGRGIREAAGAGDFAAALEAAKREASAAFGEDRVLVEKLIARPRHIEVQVFGDAQGNLVHLFERDCSLQRRRQKVIEEAPAPGMSAQMRAAMTQAALNVAHAVGYQNAGTVEFIVDAASPPRPDGFWFMEMNTRLQVEHPVTEAVTGLDLVEWQLRVAAGEKLPLTQDDITLNGWAIEARLNADDPDEEFRPSAGRLSRFRPPAARTDAAYDEGDAVPVEYDSLIAKVIRGGPDRDAAREALAQDLRELSIAGVRTNAGFLLRCLADADFSAGQVHTGLIAEKPALAPAPAHTGALAAAMLALWRAQAREAGPFGVLDGFRVNAPARLAWPLFSDRGGFDARLEKRGEAGHWRARVDGQAFDLHDCAIAADGVRARLDGAAIEARIAALAHGETLVTIEGDVTMFSPPAHAAEGDAGADVILAPLPGRIVALHVAPGARVARGAALVSLEAMKMEHVLKAPRDGVVAELLVAEGAQVKERQPLVRLAPLEDDPSAR
ncbi:MAG: biotin carboxylase N-terminal domain-containing protein [Hyphomonadaceae bacterium]